jgi:hypothetical protein
VSVATLTKGRSFPRLVSSSHEIARLLNESPVAGGTDLAVQAAKRALCILRKKSQAEFRAKALFNLGLLHLRLKAKSRALSCFEAAIRIFQKLEPTPERTEAIGQLYIYSTAQWNRRQRGDPHSQGSSGLASDLPLMPVVPPGLFQQIDLAISNIKVEVAGEKLRSDEVESVPGIP